MHRKAPFRHRSGQRAGLLRHHWEKVKRRTNIGCEFLEIFLGMEISLKVTGAGNHFEARIIGIARLAEGAAFPARRSDGTTKAEASPGTRREALARTASTTVPPCARPSSAKARLALGAKTGNVELQFPAQTSREGKARRRWNTAGCRARPEARHG